MKKIKIIAAMMLVSIAVSVKSQQLTPMQLKEARMAAYGWMNDYNLYARLDEKRNPEQKFYSLFVSDTITIANDYLPSIADNGGRITLKNYVAHIRNEDRKYDMYYSISDAEIVGESYRDGVLYFDMRFLKTIEFSERDNYADTSYAYPQKEIWLTAKLRYRLIDKLIAAETIVADSMIDNILILHDVTQIPANKYTDKFLIDEECSRRSTSLIKLSYQELDIDKQLIRMHIDTIKNNFHIGASVGLNFAQLDNSLFSTKQGVYYGFYLGYYRQLFLKNNNRLGIEINAAFTSRNMSLFGCYDDVYNSVDPNGGVYERRVNVTDFNEYVNRYSVEIPLSIRYDRIVKKNLSVFVNAGASVTYDVSQKSNISADAKYSGYYSWLFDVVIDQNGIYDFGTFEGENAKLSKTGLDKLGINIFAGVGIQHFLKKNISLEYSLQYKNMVFNKINKKVNLHLTDHSNDWNSATYFFDAFSMQNIYFNIQLNINF